MAAIQINEKQFRDLLRGEKPVLVDFWAPWCSYCRRIDPIYEMISQQLESTLVVAKVNIDQEPQLAQAEQIETIPTLILYRNGKPAGSIVAPESKAMIDAFIQEALAKQ